jgi:hypothetical protein
MRKNKQPKWHKKEFADLRQQRDYYHGIKDTENFKKYRNKLTSSIRTSKANYFSEAIKSDNNVGELWKHLKDIKSVSKGACLLRAKMNLSYHESRARSGSVICNTKLKF